MSKKLLQRIKERVDQKTPSKRKAQQLYLDQELFRDFRKECEKEDASASLIIEEMMREYLDRK